MNSCRSPPQPLEVSPVSPANEAARSDDSLFGGRGVRSFSERPEFPAADEQFGQFGLQLQAAGGRVGVEGFVDEHAVDVCLDVVAVADDVEAGPLLAGAFDVVVAAEVEDVGPVGIAAEPVDPFAVFEVEGFLLAAGFPDDFAVAVAANFAGEGHGERITIFVVARDEDEVAATALNDLDTRLRRLVKNVRLSDAEIELTQVGSRPGGELAADHPLVLAALSSLKKSGEREAYLEFGSTDASVPLNRGIPAVCVGITKGGEAHTIREYIEIRPMRKGYSAVLDLIETAFSLNGRSS